MEDETKPVYASFLLFFKCLDLQGPFLVSLPEIMQKAQFNNEMNKILGTPGNSGELFGTRNSSCLGGIHIVDLWWDHPLASWQSDIFSLWIDFKQRIREWPRQHSQFLQCFHSKHWDGEVLLFPFSFVSVCWDARKVWAAAPVPRSWWGFELIFQPTAPNTTRRTHLKTIKFD